MLIPLAIIVLTRRSRQRDDSAVKPSWSSAKICSTVSRTAFLLIPPDRLILVAS